MLKAPPETETEYDRISAMMNRPTERCYLCERPIYTTVHKVYTSDGQTQFAGEECYRMVRDSGLDGYQPPKGGPRVWYGPVFICEGCDKPHYLDTPECCEGTCAYRDFKSLNDPDYPIFECKKCGKRHFWD